MHHTKTHHVPEKIWITLGNNPSPPLRTNLSPTLSPLECLTNMPLLQIVVDDAKYEGKCGTSVLVFEDWDIIGYLATYYVNKGRDYLYKR